MLIILLLSLNIQTVSAVSSLKINTVSYDSTVVKDESFSVSTSITAEGITSSKTVTVTLIPGDGVGVSIENDAQQITFNSNTTKNVEWSLTANTPGTYSNPFTITATGTDNPATPEITSTSLTIKDRPVIDVAVIKDKSSVSAGGTVRLDYTVTNLGEVTAADATDVTAAITLPTGWSLSTGSLSYSLGTIASGGASSSGYWVVKADSPVESNTFTVEITSSIPGGTVTEDVSVTRSESSVSSSSSSSSSSSNRGAGTTSSGENNNNIQVSETKRQYISKNSKITYNFESEGNILQSITFTGLTNAGSIAAEVEVLKDISTIVDKPPAGVIYKNININVGNSNWASSENIAGAKVFFTIERSWIDTNNINIATIALNRYSDGNWDSLKTTKIGHDADFLKFEGETPGFSPFSITAEKISSTSDDEYGTGLGAESTISGEATDAIPDKTSGEGGLPGFSIIAAIFGLIIAVRQIDKRKK
jgi:PGF-pre-PGF domain-containing protein